MQSIAVQELKTILSISCPSSLACALAMEELENVNGGIRGIMDLYKKARLFPK